MKRRITFLTLFAAMSVLLFSSYGAGPYFGGAGNRTGSAGSIAGCSGSICHASTGTIAVLNITLLDNNVPVTTYMPAKTYRVRLSQLVSGTLQPRFGFQVSCVKASDGATQAGFFSTGGTANVAVYNTPLQLIEHTAPIAGQ